MYERLKVKYYIFKYLLVFNIAGIKKGKNLMVMGPVKLIIRGKMKVGDNFNVVSGNMINPLGRNLKTCLRVDNKAEICIGNNVGMSCVSIWSKEKITIRDNVKLGANVMVFDSDMHSLNFQLRRNVETDGVNAKSAPIIIDDDVFIGANSIVTKGVSIGKRSIIAAGSVVSRSIPEDEIWGGNPAKFIKKNNTFEKTDI